MKKFLILSLAILSLSNFVKANEITFWHSFTQPERVAGMER